jgi:DNA-binding Xre family transcriptional regulator
MTGEGIRDRPTESPSQKKEIITKFEAEIIDNIICCRRMLGLIAKKIEGQTNKKKIQELMIDKDITGAELAHLVGCTRQNVHLVIKGRQISPHIRKAIADALGVQVSDLWTDECEEDKR